MKSKDRTPIADDVRFVNYLQMVLARLPARARSRRQIHPLTKDLALTAATQAGTFLAGLAVISLFGRLLGAARLGEYLMVRRVMSWLLSGVQLGLGVSLARYVAYAVEAPARDREAYFITALTCLGTIAATSGLVLNLGRHFFALWLFGHQQMVSLILPLSLVLLGLAVHIAVYGYYRGCLSMGWANALDLCTVGLCPLLAVLLLFRTGSVALIVSVTGISALLCAVMFALPVVRRLRGIHLNFVTRAGELLRYGTARVPGDFGGSALFALGPIIASHYLPLGQVSYLLLGTSVLMAVSVSATPLGLVLLSKLSMMLAQGRMDEIRARLGFLLAAVLELSTFGCLQIMVFSDVLMRLWVGPGFQERIGVIRIVVLGIPFYLFYVALRSMIDAASVKAHNARNLLVSLAVFLISGMVVIRALPPRLLLEGIAATLLLALIVLACLTVYTVHRLYDLQIGWRSSVPSILLSLVLSAASLLYDRFAGFATGAVALVMLEVVMTAIFLGTLLKFKSKWLASMLDTAFPALHDG